jgi:hypothetical protein
VTAAGAVDRSATWLPLLRRLTQSSPTWVAWKSVERAFAGYGDIDSTAAADEREAIANTFIDWARIHQLGPVIICRHAPNLDVMVALCGEEPFFELDVLPRKVFLGSTMFRHDDLVPLASVDDRGMRCVRPGTEGLIKLLLNGTLRNGLPNHDALRAHGIVELLAQDAEGVRLTARLFGPGERAALQVASAVVAGGWERGAVLRLQAWFLIRALLEPRSVVNKIRFRVAKRRCPVLRAMLAGRSVPVPREAWLQRIRVGHRVYE